ncbi:hypothetical protein Q5P01_021298 [Channa striata]|uniref:ADF-H domain-containing protein n=1 Tax=Channa striata TaxID=64152 RepID=A0AA88S675_CHASR|nr:hypothetical protein Q5P01_021298 [Channa striata]
MASGVKVADEVKELYNSMKVVKADDDHKERLRIVEFAISDGYIVPSKTFREKDLEGKDTFAFFRGLLKGDQCSYMLYDCHYATKESGTKQDLVFVMWAPETAPIKLKMQYAASKDSIKKICGGLKHELQINDPADYSTRDSFAEKLGRGVTHIEGLPVCGH